MGAAETIEGNRQSFGYGRDSETPVTVKGGKRFELSVDAPRAGRTK